jgi:hypothetical protein
MTSPATPPPQGAQPEGSKKAVHNPWAWPVASVLTVLIVVGGAVVVFRSCRDLPGETLEKTGKLVKAVGRGLAEVASAFRQGTVTTTFTSYATSISGSQYLQFAELKQHEIFTRKDESSLAYGYIPLPDVIVEAKAPVTYTYYLDLGERWDFKLQDGVIWVIAPDIKFNKPAVDASRITYEVKKKSFMRDTTDAMENLKNSITLLSYQKAKTNIDLVRETGRRQTETFVQNWLAKAFADGKNYPVKVMFKSELQKSGIEAGPGRFDTPIEPATTNPVR